jgi:hypothetical protein
MELNEVYASYFVIKPTSTGSTSFSVQHKLSSSHELVLGHASLGSHSEHSNTPVAAASAHVKHFVQKGVATIVQDGSPIVIGPNISDIVYLGTAERCWARVSFVTQAFD